MNKVSLALVLFLFVAGCISTEPVISKSEMGNLELNISGPDNVPLQFAEVYIDDIYIGNISPDKPVLYIKRGEHAVRVELPGCRPYNKTITILGDPNHQVLNVILEKE